MSGKPKPCRFPGCGLVFTPGYYAEHAAAYHEGGKQRGKPSHTFGDEAGYDEVQPRCDICGDPQWREGDDWNGETGNHRTCEKKALADRTARLNAMHTGTYKAGE